MEPEWHQDISSKGIQPQHLPHFEVAGQQLDFEYRKKATQMAVTATGLTAICLVFLVVIIYLPKALNQHKTTFGQLPTTERKQKFKNRIAVRIHSVKRAEEVPGQLFTTNRARDGFTFLIADISVTNRAKESFMLNPFSFGLNTNEGKTYKSALNTHHHPDRLKNRRIGTKEKVRGVIVFQIPIQAHPDSLELMGANDTIALIQL